MAASPRRTRPWRLAPINGPPRCPRSAASFAHRPLLTGQPQKARIGRALIGGVEVARDPYRRRHVLHSFAVRPQAGRPRVRAGNGIGPRPEFFFFDCGHAIRRRTMPTAEIDPGKCGRTTNRPEGPHQTSAWCGRAPHPAPTSARWNSALRPATPKVCTAQHGPRSSPRLPPSGDPGSPRAHRRQRQRPPLDSCFPALPGQRPRNCRARTRSASAGFSNELQACILGKPFQPRGRRTLRVRQLSQYRVGTIAQIQDRTVRYRWIALNAPAATPKLRVAAAK